MSRNIKRFSMPLAKLELAQFSFLELLHCSQLSTCFLTLTDSVDQFRSSSHMSLNYLFGALNYTRNQMFIPLMVLLTINLILNFVISKET